MISIHFICTAYVVLFTCTSRSYLAEEDDIEQHQFAVIKSADSQYRNYDRPVMRDTVSTGMAEDEVVIRFITDNLGPWMLHWYVCCLEPREHLTRFFIDSQPQRMASSCVSGIDWTVCILSCRG